jgi:tetratricopeptide (TPR) repeat protein
MQRRPILTALIFLLALTAGLYANAWRGSLRIQARSDRVRAAELTSSALLWEFADGSLGGGRPTTSQGLGRAYANLEEACRLDPRLVEARVRLARACVASLRPEEALLHLDRLEEDGVRLHTIRWIRNWIQDPGRGGAHPDADEVVAEASLQPLDRLAYAHSRLTRPGDATKHEAVMELLRPLENHPILGAAARYLQFEACHTRGRRDYGRAVRYLEAAIAVVPEHPIALGNLVAVLDDARARARDDPAVSPFVSKNLDADLAALTVRLELAQVRDPGVLILWTSHGAVLLNSGRAREARELAERGLRANPDDPKLADLLSHALFAQWDELRSDGQPIPASDVAALCERLERVNAREDCQSINVLHLAKAYVLAGDKAKARKWYDFLVGSKLPKEGPGFRQRIGPELVPLAAWLEE